MSPDVPAGAAILLDFIGSIEAPKGYGTIYANKQDKLPRPLTDMTFDEVVAAGPSWSQRFGSSACGRYQFMHATLTGLKSEMGLTGSELFSPDLQDRMGFHLLKRRGYEAFVARKSTRLTFGKALAQEWASFPVLADCYGAKRKVMRGQSYYAGDGVNKALVTPERVDAALADVLAAHVSLDKPADPVVPAPEPRTDWLAALINLLLSLLKGLRK